MKIIFTAFFIIFVLSFLFLQPVFFRHIHRRKVRKLLKENGRILKQISSTSETFDVKFEADPPLFEFLNGITTIDSGGKLLRTKFKEIEYLDERGLTRNRLVMIRSMAGFPFRIYFQEELR